jgi:hypothetical protein
MRDVLSDIPLKDLAGGALLKDGKKKNFRVGHETIWHTFNVSMPYGVVVRLAGLFKGKEVRFDIR